MFKAFCIAFSMYSRIPMPHVKWEQHSIKYAICFFPLVGVVLGLISYALAEFLYIKNVNTVFFACVMTCLPIIFTGGIHFDGFIDTVDGLSSFADTKKRLEILSDPHCGAFAVVWGICYMVFTLGCWCQLKRENLFFVCVGFCVSRCLSGLAMVLFPKAKSTGLAATFGGNANKISVVALSAFLVGVMALLFYKNMAYGLTMLIIAACTFLYHYYNCIKNFGGLTGDTAGYFLQIFELAVLLFGGIIL